MDILDNFRERAKTLGKKIALPEATEPRTIQAAVIIAKEKIAIPVLIGVEKDVKTAAAAVGADLTGITIVEPAKSSNYEKYCNEFFEMRKSKGITADEAKKTMLDSIYFGNMMLHNNEVDGLVSGAEHSTADTIRPALQIIKTKPGISVVSGYFIMVVPNCEYGENGTFIYADSGVNPNPTAAQLAEIAISSAETAKVLCNMEPRVAMLSFSTKGSASHPDVDKVIEATKIAKEKAPDLLIDGELQGDAALVAAIGAKKAPGSPVAGKANVLIFPDLTSGNIAYKLTERLAKAQAIGPLLQGIRKPVNDLSRGCSVDDIVDAVAVTSIQSTIK